MFERILERLSIALSAAGIRYMIIGGQAVLVYGEPRITKDVDVTLSVEPDQAKRVIDLAIRAKFRPLPEDPESFIRDTMVLPAIDDESGIRVDLIFSQSAYERQAMDRVRTIRVGNADVRFASAEDVVIHKIVAGRPRDIEDVASLMIKQRDLDIGYIERWLTDFSAALAEPLLDRFRRIREERGPSS